ncbi:MAG: VOC family protein [Verrucomicrobiota bacterium]
MKTSIIAIFLLSFALPLFADDHAKESPFLRTTIDLGTVVSDLDASVKFYTEAIGFKEVAAFHVPTDMAKDSGLTAGDTLDIKVLVLGEGDTATKLKLMQGIDSTEKSKNEFINSQHGFSYLTVFVKSTDDALAKLKKAGVEPIANGPVTLPENLDPSMALTIVRDPDGNFVELVGPKPTK